MLPCILVCFVLIFDLLWSCQTVHFWSCLLFVQCIVPSAHCCAQLQLSINNENMQGLLAQVSSISCSSAVFLGARLCFWGSCVSVFYKDSWELLFCSSITLCYTSACRMQKGHSQLPVPSHLLLKCRNRWEPCLEHRREYYSPKRWVRKMSLQPTDQLGLANRQALCLSSQQLPAWSDWSCNIRIQSKFG